MESWKKLYNIQIEKYWIIHFLEKAICKTNKINLIILLYYYII